MDFKGKKRCNDTHASTTDPDARLYRKSKNTSAQLCHMGHVLLENRNGLVVDVATTQANGTAKREAAATGSRPRADPRKLARILEICHVYS